MMGFQLLEDRLGGEEDGDPIPIRLEKDPKPRDVYKGEVDKDPLPEGYEKDPPYRNPIYS
ncbi:hypothetical protein JW711_01350 [Candidatus Woesearchaeota archaeon]|nr:hypothetical protein [Candidatus Woesearchaeota archaeon]